MKPEISPDVDRAVRESLVLFTGSLVGEKPDSLTTRACLRALRDVPVDVIYESADRIVRTPGRKPFLPATTEWLGVCAEIVAERRRVLGLQSAALQAECERCYGSGWTEVEIDGYARVQRCGCHAAAMEIMAGAPKALPMPRDEHEDGAA
jgi:hypothetical protein